MATVVDTLIIGGGPVGSSTAHHLASACCSSSMDADRVIWVVEQDPTYRTASATVSAAGIRQQFSLRENVQMSAYGRDFLRQVPELLRVHNHNTNHMDNVPNVHFVEHGYLFLAASDAGVQQLVQNHQTQHHANCQVEIDLLSPTALKERFPWLNVEDIQLGSLGIRGEGWFDPWALLMGWKEKNIRDLGVVYKHAKPIGARRHPDSGRLEAIQLYDLTTHTTEWIAVGQVVNAAGPYAHDLLQLLGGGPGSLSSPFPVRPRKRSMFYFHCQLNQKDDGIVVPTLAPLTIDPLTGVYFRTEGTPGAGNFVCGVSPPSHQDVDCLDPSQDLRNADHELWDSILWPALYHRVPAFGNIKLQSSWAGLYEYNTLDQNAIIDFHPEIPNLLLVNGFSGHGLQQSPAAGRAGAELLQYGHFQTLDLSIFSYDRILQGQPVYEQGIV
jgi:FAD-dependent oxidoreductase domain-containing protein 1